MIEIRKKGFEVKKSLPFLAIAGMSLGLSLLAIDAGRVEEMLRHEFAPTFKSLVNGSNERKEVEQAMELLPDGSEQRVAAWMNQALSKSSRAIAMGHVKPHHVMVDVLRAALSLGDRF